MEIIEKDGKRYLYFPEESQLLQEAVRDAKKEAQEIYTILVKRGMNVTSDFFNGLMKGGTKFLSGYFEKRLKSFLIGDNEGKPSIEEMRTIKKVASDAVSDIREHFNNITRIKQILNIKADFTNCPWKYDINRGDFLLKDGEIQYVYDEPELPKIEITEEVEKAAIVFYAINQNLDSLREQGWHVEEIMEMIKDIDVSIGTRITTDDIIPLLMRKNVHS